MCSPRRVMSGFIVLSCFIMLYQQIQLMYNDGGVWFWTLLNFAGLERITMKRGPLVPYFPLGLNFKLGDIIHLL